MYPPSNRLRRIVRLFLTTTCAAALGVLAGCGKEQADEQVRDHIAEAVQATEAGVNSVPNLPAGYGKAAGITNASPEVRAQALSHLAEAERERAVALMAQADRQEVDLIRLVAAANRQAARIQSNNTAVAALQRLEPGKVRQAIQQRRGAAAEGVQNAVWVEHESGAVPALKGVQEQLTQLQQQADQLQRQIKDLAAQRQQAVSQAEDLDRQSREAQGQQSVELFKQSSEARKKAADLAVQTEALNAKLAPVQEDLRRAQSNQEILNKSIAGFDAQLQGTQQNWQAVQQQIAALQNLSKQILDGGGNEPAATQPAEGAAPVPTSLSGKLHQLNQLASGIAALRGEAEGLLKSAVDHYQQAATAAQQVSSQLGQKIGAGSARPERSAWQGLVELNNPAGFKLNQATTQVLLAGLYRNRSAEAAMRADLLNNLGPILQQAKLQTPADAGNAQALEGEANTARQTSAQLYGEAQQLLQEVVETPKSSDLAGTTARAAHLMQLVRLYAQAQLDPQNASRLIAQAKQIAAQGDAVDLPQTALPAYLLDALELRSPATTQPAGAATQPAAPATQPAPEPAAPPPTAAPAPTQTPPAPAETPPAETPPAATDQTPAPDSGAAPAPEQAAPQRSENERAPASFGKAPAGK